MRLRFFLLFFLSRKVKALILHARNTEGDFSLHARCVDGTLSLNARCTDADALSPTTKCGDGALSLHEWCVSGVLKEKEGVSRSFLKVDEVDVYPYHLGEMEFSS